MPTPPRKSLPRLSRESYQGHAFVHWTYATGDRKVGWLSPTIHLQFREALLHALHRFRLACPAYTLMPDHLHMLIVGLDEASDQLNFNRSFRRRLNQLTQPYAWQSQGHDHVLRENEREKGAFQSACHYIFNNPVRAELVAESDGYPFSGCLFPGYYDFDPRNERYWELFWKAYNKAVSR